MNAGELCGPPFRVLVAEDFADFRARLRELLGSLPLELVEAPDGQAAIDIVTCSLRTWTCPGAPAGRSSTRADRTAAGMSR